jgi:hypothetical protein
LDAERRQPLEESQRPRYLSAIDTSYDDPGQQMGYWAALINAYTRDFLGPLGHIQPAVCVYKRLPARQGVRDVIKSILAVNNEAQMREI